MRTVLLIILSTSVLLSCTSIEEKQEKDTYQILSLLVDEFGTPIRPPSDGKNSHFTKERIDSIMNQKQTIGVYQVLKHREEKVDISISTEDVSYLELLKLFNSYTEDINLDITKIKSNKDYNIIFLDSLLSKQEQYNTYDKQLFFSRVAFDNDFKKALTTISIKHSGYFLCLLEKEKEKWRIRNSKMIYIY
jgi:hypothetical protein